MSDPKLNSKIPEGPLKDKWSKRKNSIRVVSPNNRRKLEVIGADVSIETRRGVGYILEEKK